MDASAVLDGAAAKSLSFIDGDGTVVVVALKGAQAEITIAGDVTSMETAGGQVSVIGAGLSIATIDILQSTAKGSLTISATGGDELANVGEVRGSGPLKSFIAPSVDLTGAGIVMAGQGTIAAVQVHDTLNGADIILPGAAGGKGVSVAARLLSAGTDVIVGQGLKSLALRGWESGQLTATQAKSISVKSGTAAAFDGDFAAAMTLTGAGVAARGLTLANCSIAGTLGGNMTVTGSVGRFQAGHIEADVAISGSAKSFSVGDTLAILPALDGTSNRIQIAGSAKVYGHGESFSAADVDLYAASDAVYDLVGLDGLTDGPQWWEYDLSMTLNIRSQLGGASSEQTSGEGVRLYLDSYSDNDGRVLASTHMDTYDEDTGQWVADNDPNVDRLLAEPQGMRLTELDGGFLGEFKTMYLERFVTSPRYLAVGDDAQAHAFLDSTYTVADEYPLDLHGPLDTSISILGHEAVTVPAGEFLAVTYAQSRSFVASGTAKVDGQTLSVRFTLSIEEIYWADGIHGVLQSTRTHQVVWSVWGGGNRWKSITVTSNMAMSLTDSSTLQ